MPYPTNETAQTDLRIEVIQSLGNACEDLGYFLAQGETELIFTQDESKKMVKLLSDLYEMQQELASRSRREEAAKRPLKPPL